MSELIAHLQELVQEAVAPLAGVTRRRVLRSDGWFVRGSLFTLVNRDARIVVRLDDLAAQDEAHALAGAAGWAIGKKKPMRAWVLLPETFHDDPEAIAGWVKRAWELAPKKVAKKTPSKRRKNPSR
jgi:TfoX/Sxy family transcriptional regulator of competence genes